jgi:hypothetical protein
MNMVRHEAVRNYCKLVFRGSARNLRKDQIDRVASREQISPLVSAESQ